MQNNYYLPGLNENTSNEYSCVQINRTDTPKIFLFISNVDLFCKRYCKSLDSFKLREKRLLDFETPNRALITHEYDVEVDDDFDYTEYYYLFNPIKRLSWLKIAQDGKRLSIAKESDIKKKIYKVLEEELNKASINFDELWNNRKGLPCFIKILKSQYNNFLITASYYDSIKSSFKERKSFLSPLMERRIKYDYLPLEGKSSWLYVKAPNNFNVKYNSKLIRSSAHNRIDFANSDGNEADPGKVSLTIINNGVDTSVNDVASLSIDISIPSSLKTWFMSIYYISIVVMSILSLALLNELWLLFWSPIINCKSIVDFLLINNNFGGIIMGLVAAIITTRSWLISEETITKYYSIYITRIMVIILVLYTIIMTIS